jgi:hypothetical protein
MQSTFEQKLSSAVRAGWWTLLIAVGMVLIQWIGTAAFISRHPGWFLRFWAPHMTWPQIERITMQFLLSFRVFVGIFATILIWASVWSLVLKRRVGATRATFIAPPTTAVPVT